MAQYPKYDFSNPSLNYETVLDTTKEMYADLNHQGGCCVSKNIESVFNQVNTLLMASEIDINDEDRFKADVKSAYLLLYSIV